jgi:hypothetical protein
MSVETTEIKLTSTATTSRDNQWKNCWNDRASRSRRITERLRNTYSAIRKRFSETMARAATYDHRKGERANRTVRSVGRVRAETNASKQNTLPHGPRRLIAKDCVTRIAESKKGYRPMRCNPSICLVAGVGFEPTTFGL